MINKKCGLKAREFLSFWFVFFIFGLLFFILAGGCAENKSEKLETVKVTRGNILARIPATGTVMPRNRLEIKPPVAGRIESILVNEGDRVKKGGIVAWISSNERAALLDAARAKGTAEVKYWENVYKAAPLVAPLNGFIIQRRVEPGQTLTTGDPVLVMADQLIVKAQVDETDLGKIRLNQKVSLELDAYPERSIRGRVEHIAYESKVISNVTIYEVDILPDRVPPYFRAGMSATASFLQEKRDRVLLLPLRAVKKMGNRTFIFIPRGGNQDLEAIPINTGLENDENVEITAGLSEGMEVVIPSAKLAQETLQKRQRRNFGPMGLFGRQRR